MPRAKVTTRDGGDERWQEVADIGEPVTLEYPSELLATFRFPIGTSAGEYDMRYEDMRQVVADMINRVRQPHGETLPALEFDVWIGQACLAGQYQDEMFVTVAARRGELPVSALREGLKGRQHHEEPGRSPVVDGAFPELRVRGGTVAGTWSLSRDLCLELSRAYQAAHCLAPRTRDPYIQMASGASEPLHFILHQAAPRLDRAIEVIPSAELFRDLIPDDPQDRTSWVAFGLSHDFFSTHETVDAAWDQAAIVHDALATAADPAGLPLDTLRSWLFGEALKAHAGDEYDHDAVGDVLAAVRRSVPNRAPVPDPEHVCAVPAASARWSPTLEEFALTFNGYRYWGSFSRCSGVAAAVRDGWRRNGRLPRSLTTLRTALFFEQRSARHVGAAPPRAEMKYLRALVEAIRRQASTSDRPRRPRPRARLSSRRRK